MKKSILLAAGALLAAAALGGCSHPSDLIDSAAAASATVAVA